MSNEAKDEEFVGILRNCLTASTRSVSILTSKYVRALYTDKPVISGERGGENTVLYFAYSSNMNQQDLDNYCRKKGRPLINLDSRSPNVCVLGDFRLDFNYYSPSRGGGTANIEPAPREHVEGVLFDIDNVDKKTIDAKEGAPWNYRRIFVSVISRDGTKKENVITYTVCEDRKTEFTPPTREYKQIVINGARAFGLSEEWIEKLEKIPSRN